MNPVSTAPKYPYGELWDTGWIHSRNLPLGCPENLLHFRVSRDLRVIGQGNAQTQIAHYWTGKKWMPLGSTIGTNIGAFGPDGTVYVSTGEGVKVFDREGNFVRLIPGYVGANGIRWVRPDGSVVSGDSTYSHPSGIHQFTDCDGVLIGQGPEFGTVVYIDGKLRWLQQNHVLQSFIRANRVGDVFYIHIAQEAGALAIPIVITLEELRALPEVASAPKPPVVQPPPPEPKPVSDTTTLQAPNLKVLVDRVFAEHPEVKWSVDVDDVRGVGVDWFCHEANKLDPREPWGRKARSENGSRKNGDSAVFKRTDGRMEIYDIIANGHPSWQKPSRSLANGENGYWAPANAVPEKPQTPPQEPPVEPPHVDPPSPPPTVPAEHSDELKAILEVLKQSEADDAQRDEALRLLEQQELDTLKGIRSDLQALGDQAKQYLPGLMAVLAGGNTSGLGSLLGGILKKKDPTSGTS